jgi:outer membrane protein OmpA-like peptidoglycan-associated protein
MSSVVWKGKKRSARSGTAGKSREEKAREGQRRKEVESMHTYFVRVSWMVLLPLLPMSMGCVSYQAYKQTKKELENAKSANDDLVKKYNQAIQELMRQGKGANGPEFAKLQEEIARLKAEKADTLGFLPTDVSRVSGAEFEKGGLRLGETLLFSEGSDRLKKGAFRTLDELVKLLQTEYPGGSIVIEGHTDNQPLRRTVGIHKHNINLGYKRAYAVFKYFQEQGIPESSMVVTTYSFNKPIEQVDPNSKAGRAKNRRVVVRRGETRI